jgi:hypothetical protein
MTTANIISVLAALVYLALVGLALAASAWIGGRLFDLGALSFRRFIGVGMVQAAVAGICLEIVSQVLQLSIALGLGLTVVLVLLVGLGEMRRAMRTTWKQALKPWGLASIFQVVFAFPTAVFLSALLPAILNLLFPPVA